MDLSTWAQSIAAGERAPLARGLNLVEDTRPRQREQAGRLLAELPRERLAAHGQLVGITGPPGAGKSTLVAALIGAWRADGLSVGVLAVDPSSPLSGGALLGDRVRMNRRAPDPQVFIRSLAGRGEPGGLSGDVYPMSQLMLAAFDRVVVETIGVGQTEVDVVEHTDTVCLVVQPASGDMIQFLKAGIIEVPAIFVVNKSDLGMVAQRAAGDLAVSLNQHGGDDWVAPVVLASAKDGVGVASVTEAMESHRLFLGGQESLPRLRLAQGVAWARKRLQLEFGSYGIAALGGKMALDHRLQQQAVHDGVFAALGQLRGELMAKWGKSVAACPGG